MNDSAIHAGPGQANALNLTLANAYPATSLPGEGDLAFCSRVSQLTDGRMRVSARCDAPDGLDSRQQFDAVSAGRLAMADCFAGALGDVDAVFQLSSLPFLAATTDEARRLFELARPRYEAVLAESGQRLLWASPWPPTGLWTRQRIADAQQLHGLRVRTYDEASAKVFSRLGAAAVSAPFSEAVAMLAAGQLDAVMSSGDGGAGARLWQALPCFTPLHYAVPLSLTLMHVGSWHALDAASREAIDSAAADTQQAQWLCMQDRVSENYDRLRAAGAMVAPPPAPSLQAAFDAAAAAVIADWLAGAGGPVGALLAAFRRAA